MKIQGVAFDLEGTLVNVEEIHFNAFVLAAQHFGLSISFEDILKHIPRALGGGDKLISEGLELLSSGKTSARHFLDKKREYYGELIVALENIEPRPGCLEVLQQITEMGFKTAIGSLTITSQAIYLLERSGLSQVFDPDTIILAENVRRLKPFPDVYLETAKCMGVWPQTQLVFEDSTTGMMAAIKAGSKVVAMPVYISKDNLQKIVQIEPCRIFWDWREVNTEALITNLNENE